MSVLRDQLQQVAEVFAYNGPNYRLELRPLSDLYFHYWTPSTGNVAYVYILSAIAVIILLIACANYVNLAMARSAGRTKEIGIHKVFGASTRNIVALLSKDFAWLVLAAFLIAAPVAYYAMSRWLEDFAYRIELGPWLLVGAGVLALPIAMATVSYQAVRAALTNRADTLRYE